MAKRDDTAAAQIERVGRSLQPFDPADEAREMLAPRGEHPAAYDLEQFAAGELHDTVRQESIASHVHTCALCRDEVAGWRAALETGADGAPPPAARDMRALLRVPMAAAAAGGHEGRRCGQGVAVHVIAPPAIPELRVVAIRLEDRTLRPSLLRVWTSPGEVLEQALPPPDSNGVIQFTRLISSPDDQAFVELLLTAQLELLAEDA